MAGEMIEVNIGGDASPYVTQAQASLNANNQLIRSVQQVNQVLQKEGEAHEKATSKTKKHGKSTKGASDQIGILASQSAKAGAAIKTMVAGYLGVQGIQKAWRFIGDEIRRVIDAQRELGDMSMTMREASKGVMLQTGMTYEESKSRVLDIMEKGRFTQPGQARAVINKANSAFGALGKETETEMTDVLADFVGRYALGPGESGMLIEVAKKFKANNAKSLKKALEQIWGGSISSLAEFNEYTRGLAKGAPELAEKGISPAMIVSLMTRGRETKATGEEAAELLRQMNRLTGKAEVQKAVGKEFGMSGLEYMQMDDKDRQFLMLGQYVAKYSNTKKLQGLLEAEQLNVAQTMFTPEGQKLIEARRSMFGAKSAAGFDVTKAGYDPILLALEKDLSEAAVEVHDISAELERGTTSGKGAGAIRRKVRAFEDVEGLSEGQQRNLRRQYWTSTETAEQGITLREATRSRVEKIRQEGIAAGDIGRGGWLDFSPTGLVGKTARGEQIQELLMMAGGLGDLADTPKEYGTYTNLLESIEGNTDPNQGPKKPAYDPN